MDSRVSKYYNNELQNDTTSFSTRSGRNARLYREVYGKYGEFDNLPLEDNTDEIDMDRLRELLSNSQKKQEPPRSLEDTGFLEKRKRQIDEQKVYDINKILEKAKYENNKLKDTTSMPKVNRQILSTLQSNELSLKEIQEKCEQYQRRNADEEEKPDQLSMTRELKYQNLLSKKVDEEEDANVLEDTSLKDEDLSLDLFSDLKPTGNTIVTKPIREEEESHTSPIKNDFHSDDTRDIDIIKPNQKKEESDFFTSSYEFSKKDFTPDDDFEDLKDKGGLLKIIFLVLAIIIFIGVIVYFVGTYGLGL